jgi:hypothetical protein
MITLTDREWKRVYKELKDDYANSPSMFLIRDKMKRELGFTPRFHSEWKTTVGYVETVYLDFYNDASESWFRLKYLNRD